MHSPHVVTKVSTNCFPAEASGGHADWAFSSVQKLGQKSFASSLPFSEQLHLLSHSQEVQGGYVRAGGRAESFPWILSKGGVLEQEKGPGLEVKDSKKAYTVCFLVPQVTTELEGGLRSPTLSRNISPVSFIL